MQRVRRAYREGGVALVAQRVYERLCRDLVLYALDLDVDVPDDVGVGPPEVRALSLPDLDAYLALRPDEDESTVRARLRRGDLCFVSWNGDSIVGGAWARFDRIWVSDLGTWIPLQPDEAYGYASFTHPAYRRRGSASACTAAIIRQLRSLGYRRLVAYVVRENAAGRASLETLGFASFGRIRWFHIARVGFELRTGGRMRPRVRLHTLPSEIHE